MAAVTRQVGFSSISCFDQCIRGEVGAAPSRCEGSVSIHWAAECLFGVRVEATILCNYFLLGFLFLYVQPSHIVTIILFRFRRRLRINSRYQDGLFRHGAANLMPLFSRLHRIFMGSTMFPVTTRTFGFASLHLIIRTRAWVNVTGFLNNGVIIAQFRLTFQ